MHAVVPMAVVNTGCRVKVYTPFDGEVSMLSSGIYSTGGLKLSGVLESERHRPCLVTSNPVEAAADVDMVLLVLPAFAHGEVLTALAPHLPEGVFVGAMPARSGFKYQACRVMADYGPSEFTVFGLQTLPWACRITQYGAEVEILGIKNSIGVAAIPKDVASTLAVQLTGMLGLYVYALPNMMALSLANVGQIIHPGIMYGLFRDYNGKPFSEHEIPLFYNGVDEGIATVLQSLSDEIQVLTEKLQDKLGPAVNLAGVPTLRQWLIESYSDQIEDAGSLARVFSTNRAYRGLKAPVKRLEDGGFVPDFQSRYLVEDVPVGLLVTCALARLAGVPTPKIDRVITATSAWMGREYLVDGRLVGRDIPGTRIPQNYGVNDLADLKNLVLRGGLRAGTADAKRLTDVRD